jgi:hypothetical protein
VQIGSGTSATRREPDTNIAHRSRVNSLTRLRYAVSIGCDSVDGTYLAYGPDRNLPALLRWLATVSGGAGHSPSSSSTEHVTSLAARPYRLGPQRSSPNLSP